MENLWKNRRAPQPLDSDVNKLADSTGNLVRYYDLDTATRSLSHLV